MLEKVFLASVAAAALIALRYWRAGIYLMIVFSAIQDPVRKMIPGAPAYLVLATVPLWAAIIVSAMTANPALWSRFRRAFPYLSSTLIVLVVALLPAAAKSATYGRGSWQLTLLGAFSYATVLFGLLVGFGFMRGARDLNHLVAFYCLVHGVMLVGGLLEHLDLVRSPALGTQALGVLWIRTARHLVVPMVAGFYRSPDIMGWHAVMVLMLGVSLALVCRGWRRTFWVLVAAWAGISVMLCARRKMAFMLPMFVLLLAWFHARERAGRSLVGVSGALALVAFFGFIMYAQVARTEEIEVFYFRRYEDARERLTTQNLGALLRTYQQSGFFGEGLGTATQGRQHLNVDKPKTWQEGGLARLLVELGVPGFLAALWVAYALIRSLRSLVHRFSLWRRDFPLFAGLVAVLFANMATFVVSHQVFGDPFVNVFLAFLIGVALSGRRLIGPSAIRHEPSVAAGERRSGPEAPLLPEQTVGP